MYVSKVEDICDWQQRDVKKTPGSQSFTKCWRMKRDGSCPQLLSVRLDYCYCIRPVTSCTALGLRNSSSCFCLFLSLFVRFGSGGLRGWNIFYNGPVPTACMCMLYVLSACPKTPEILNRISSNGRAADVYNSLQFSSEFSFSFLSSPCCLSC
jgi:hypothetical protein